MERCTRVLISDPEERKGKWRELMPEAKEVFLELGCGKGRFTAETAAQNPFQQLDDLLAAKFLDVTPEYLHDVLHLGKTGAAVELIAVQGIQTITICLV